MYQRPTTYIARKEDFQKAITDQGCLRVIGVSLDGTIFKTELSGYITKIELLGADRYTVTLNSHKNNASLELTLI